LLNIFKVKYIAIELVITVYIIVILIIPTSKIDNFIILQKLLVTSFNNWAENYYSLVKWYDYKLFYISLQSSLNHLETPISNKIDLFCASDLFLIFFNWPIIQKFLFYNQIHLRYNRYFYAILNLSNSD
jgi:hypothetical protein